MAPQPFRVSVPTKPSQPCAHQRQEQPPGNAKESLKHRYRFEVRCSTFEVQRATFNVAAAAAEGVVPGREAQPGT